MNIIEVNLSNEFGITQTEGVTQWDYGYVMHISGLDIQSDTEVHFANHGDDKAIIEMGKYTDGILVVEVPDILWTKGTDVFTFIYESTDTEGKTIRTARTPVTRRAKPDDYVAPDTKNYLMTLLADAEKIVTEANIDKQKLEATTITTTHSGQTILTTDSANVPPLNIIPYGKSSQKTYEGNQLLDLPDGSYQRGEATYNIDNGVVNVVANTTSEASYMHSLLDSGLKAGKYYVGGGSTNVQVRVSYNDGTGWKYILDGQSAELNDFSTYTNIGYQIVIGANKTVDETIYPMLYQNGNGTWEPYVGNAPSPSMAYSQPIESLENVEVKVLGKNIYGGKYYYIGYANGIPFVDWTKNQESDVVLPYTPEHETQGIGCLISCKKGVQYTMSASNPNPNAWLGFAEYKSAEGDYIYSVDNAIGSVESFESSITYTAQTDGVLLCAIAGKWTDGTTSIHTCTEDEQVQVEIGSVATEYEEPREVQTLTLPYTLRGNGDVRDSVSCAEGKRKQRVIEYDVNLFIDDIRIPSDSSWYDSEKSYSYECYLRVATTARGGGLCTHFTNYAFHDFYMQGIETGLFLGNGMLIINISKELGICTTIDELKQWLADNEVKFTQILQEPIITDLTEEEIAQYKAIVMNKGYNTIINSAGAFMEVETVCDTQLHIEQNYTPNSVTESILERLSNVETQLASNS